MAKQANGYLGGFIGKLGPAVGYQWKHVWCLRSRPRRVNNPRTEAQQEHRAMFKEEVRLAGRMRWGVNVGFKALSDEYDMTAQNLFVKANQQCFRTVEGHFTVDYTHLSISDGPVAPVEITAWNVDGDNVLSVNFEKNPLHLSCSQHDNVYVYVWCPEVEKGYLANPVYRRAKSMSTLLPQLMADKEIHVYAFVQDEKGHCSPTAYGEPAETAEATEGRGMSPQSANTAQLEPQRGDTGITERASSLRDSTIAPSSLGMGKQKKVFQY